MHLVFSAEFLAKKKSPELGTRCLPMLKKVPETLVFKKVAQMVLDPLSRYTLCIEQMLCVFHVSRPLSRYTPQKGPSAPLLPSAEGGYRRLSCPQRGIALYPCTAAIVTLIAV